jgi:hypothetical protein
MPRSPHNAHGPFGVHDVNLRRLPESERKTTGRSGESISLNALGRAPGRFIFSRSTRCVRALVPLRLVETRVADPSGSLRVKASSVSITVPKP